MTIAQREVNGNTQLDLAPAKDILQESMALVEIEVLESGRLVLASAVQLVLKLAFAEHGDVASDVSQIDMFATFL